MRRLACAAAVPSMHYSTRERKGRKLVSNLADIEVPPPKWFRYISLTHSLNCFCFSYTSSCVCVFFTLSLPAFSIYLRCTFEYHVCIGLLANCVSLPISTNGSGLPWFKAQGFRMLIFKDNRTSPLNEKMPPQHDHNPFYMMALCRTKLSLVIYALICILIFFYPFVTKLCKSNF